MDFDHSTWISFDAFYDDYEDSLSGSETDYKDRPDSPTLNLQADAATLRCLRWIVVNQDAVTYDLKSMPELENYKYASSDEEIWTALSEKKSEPPDNKKKKQAVFNIHKTCEWQRCNATFAQNVDYRVHINKHLQAYLTDHSLSHDQDYHCEWDLCGYKTDEVKSFESHVIHHEIHGRLMARGEAFEMEYKLPKCKMSGLDRNRILDVPHAFVCLWADCGEKCKSLSVLEEHLLEHTVDLPKRGNLDCQWRDCGLSYNSQAKLRTHIKKSNHLSLDYFVCRQCGIRRERHAFKRHFLSQAPVKNPELCCPHCNRLQLDKRSLNYHIRNFHGNKVCELCGMVFANVSKLTLHLAHVHANLRAFKCTKCPQSFHTAANLRTHLKVHEREPEGYSCNQCSHVSVSLSALKAHEYHKHKRNLPYECHLCGKQFNRSDYIVNHFKKVHNLGIPVGYNKYTYRQDEDMVLRLKTTVPYELKSARDSNTPRPPIKRFTVSADGPKEMEVKFVIGQENRVLNLDLTVKKEDVESPGIKTEEKGEDADASETENESECESESSEEEVRITRSRTRQMLAPVNETMDREEVVITGTRKRKTK